MRCSKCGAEVPQGFKFCNMCGEPLAMTPVAGTVTQSSRHTPGQDKWLVIIGLLLVAVLVVACIGAILLFGLLATTPANKNLSLAESTPITSPSLTNTLSATVESKRATIAPPPSPAPTLRPTIAPRPSSPPVPLRSPTRAPGSLAKITVDDWEIVVTKVTFADKLSASGFVEKAHGRFANIFMTVTNRGYSQDTFVAYGILIVKDAAGVVYEENGLASALAQEQFNTDIGARINPDDSANVVAVFDISTSSAYYALSQGTLAKRSSGSVALPIK
ncbi:MAG: DUF4352 domain-containing protein [Chloroflexota bacterium]|nr:DUF4352 domain-containing protein [Chloroflexota bacterium]